MLLYSCINLIIKILLKNDFWFQIIFISINIINSILKLQKNMSLFLYNILFKIAYHLS